jgi:hypothetical protein
MIIRSAHGGNYFAGLCASNPGFTTIPLTWDTRRRLMDVLEKLEPLSEQNGLLKFLRNEDHVGLLNGFVQGCSPCCHGLPGL